MSYKVSIGGFEGPFDLLLSLVSRQKVDVGAISISQIADQYMAELERMREVDLDVASDFVLVAATLLELKAAALTPEDEPVQTDGLEYEDLTPDELREVLLARLITYRQFKGAALALAARSQTESLMRPCSVGLGEEFDQVTPDYLKGVPLADLAARCARLVGRKERILLQSEHIAARRIPLETRVEQVDRMLTNRGSMTFEELVADDSSTQNRVVSLLAILELHKRRSIALNQPELFGPILIERLQGAEPFVASRDAADLSVENVLAANERANDE